MTNSQKNLIEQQLFLGENNPDKQWAKVYCDTLAKFRYENEQTLLDMRYGQHKSRYNIMKKLNMTKDAYYYSLRKVLNFSFARAKELKLI